ncbi:retroviral-like aspartic protease family protein [Gluconobacter sp. Dm-62]|uniref:retroviral-like aspartic protease family protein n=1 Tax=Gluconobacter sp. Dm-62 TaxID=2799804 RepID=UPI001B8B9197|nr:retroviral-like aspartic protease family protein [Gluconobacter sp. Dm-62]MBS1103566.1 retroviral-like aspartic protease family protein [Gluconobacter sp. Dm-62]
MGRLLFRRTISPVFIALLGLIAPAEARTIHDCVLTSEVLPFLNPAGAPVIHVQINGKDAGAFFSTLTTLTSVWDAKGFNFYRDDFINTTSVTGSGTNYTTTIHTLQIGNSVVKNMSALLVNDQPPEAPDGLPLMLDLGWDILGQFYVLIDRHSQKMAFFTYDGAQDCPDIGTLLQNPGPFLPLSSIDDESSQKNQVTVLLDGQKVDMQVNTSANRSIIQQRIAREMGISRRILSRDDEIRVGAGEVLLGHRHHFKTLQLGTHVLHDVTLDVVPDAEFNILGMDILKHFNILINSEVGKLWLEDYTPPPGQVEEKALPWSPTHDRLGHTHASEEKPAGSTESKNGGTKPSPRPTDDP